MEGVKKNDVSLAKGRLVNPDIVSYKVPLRPFILKHFIITGLFYQNICSGGGGLILPPPPYLWTLIIKENENIEILL